MYHSDWGIDIEQRIKIVFQMETMVVYDSVY